MTSHSRLLSLLCCFLVLHIGSFPAHCAAISSASSSSGTVPPASTCPLHLPDAHLSLQSSLGTSVQKASDVALRSNRINWGFLGVPQDWSSVAYINKLFVLFASVLLMAWIIVGCFLGLYKWDIISTCCSAMHTAHELIDPLHLHRRTHSMCDTSDRRGIQWVDDCTTTNLSRTPEMYNYSTTPVALSYDGLTTGPCVSDCSPNNHSDFDYCDTTTHQCSAGDMTTTSDCLRLLPTPLSPPLSRETTYIDPMTDSFLPPAAGPGSPLPLVKYHHISFALSSSPPPSLPAFLSDLGIQVPSRRPRASSTHHLTPYYNLSTTTRRLPSSTHSITPPPTPTSSLAVKVWSSIRCTAARFSAGLTETVTDRQAIDYSYEACGPPKSGLQLPCGLNSPACTLLAPSVVRSLLSWPSSPMCCTSTSAPMSFHSSSSSDDMTTTTCPLGPCDTPSSPGTTQVPSTMPSSPSSIFSSDGSTPLSPPTLSREPVLSVQSRYFCDPFATTHFLPSPGIYTPDPATTPSRLQRLLPRYLAAYVPWCITNRSLILLLVLRAFLYSWVLLVWLIFLVNSLTVRVHPDEAPPYPVYMFFTFWNFALLSLYLFLAMIYSATFVLRKYRYDMALADLIAEAASECTLDTCLPTLQGTEYSDHHASSVGHWTVCTPVARLQPDSQEDESHLSVQSWRTSPDVHTSHPSSHSSPRVCLPKAHSSPSLPGSISAPSSPISSPSIPPSLPSPPPPTSSPSHPPMVNSCGEVIEFRGLRGAKWTWLRRFLWLLFQQQLTGNLIVTVSFWILTFPRLCPTLQKAMLAFPILSQHAFNLVFIVLECCANRLPVVFSHAGFVMATSLCYLLLATTMYGALPSIPLDLTRDSTAVILVGLLFLHLASHWMFTQVSHTKFSYFTAPYLPAWILYPSLFPHKQSTAGRASQECREPDKRNECAA